MNKLRIKGLNNIEISSIIEANTDYLVSLRVARKGRYLPDSQGEETEDELFDVHVLHLEQLLKIGDSKPIKVSVGNSPSKKLRFDIESWAKRQGIEDEDKVEEFYQQKILKVREWVWKQN